MQAYGERKRLTGPDGDNAREPDGFRAQGVSARGGSFREQVQRLPSRQEVVFQKVCPVLAIIVK